jgi:CRP/FNR family transcriptional regulator
MSSNGTSASEVGGVELTGAMARPAAPYQNAAEQKVGDIYEVFERVPWLVRLDRDDRRAVSSNARVRELRRGAALAADEQLACGIAFVAQGVVKVAKRQENGRETILRLFATGDLIHFAPSLLGDDAERVARQNRGSSSPPPSGGSSDSHDVQYIALEDQTRILILEPGPVLELVERDPVAARSLLQEVGIGYLELRERVEDLSTAPVPRRIARLMARLATRFGVRQAGGRVRIDLPLARQDIADMCATTIETAIRVMSRLQREGVVETRSEGFVIHDMARLERIGLGRDPLRARVN